MIEAATSLPDEQVLQEEIVPLERELEESTPAEEPVIAMSAEGPIIINDVVSADLESPKEVSSCFSRHRVISNLADTSALCDRSLPLILSLSRLRRLMTPKKDTVGTSRNLPSKSQSRFLRRHLPQLSM